MKKIPTLFERNYDGDRRVRDEIVPAAIWVTTGEGTATRKFDGTCCLVRDGKLWKRYEARNGARVPTAFCPATDIDEVTGKIMGWLPVGDGPEDRWHREAFSPDLPDGTYELVGPKVQGNPEHYAQHTLVAHGCEKLDDVPRDFGGLRAYLQQHDFEGIVWHHPDGRMAKIKIKDFGLTRRTETR